MAHNFMLFSELQKKVTTSPIKTWRLLKELRDNGRMKEVDDWTMVDRKLFVNVPRFVVELEQMGYAVKSDDIKNDSAISGEFKNLLEEMKLISTEITERSIQDEMNSADIKYAPSGANIKSSESRHEEPTRKSDGISSEMISPEINLKSPEFNLLLRSKDDVIATKDSQITTMTTMYTKILEQQDKMIQSKDTELKEVRTALESVVKQNETLVHQNVFLTRLLTGPKQDRAEPQQDDVISPEFRDGSKAAPEYKNGAHAPESTARAASDTGMPAESVPVDHRTIREVPIESDHVDGEQSTPEDIITSV